MFVTICPAELSQSLIERINEDCTSGSSLAKPMIAPIRRIRSPRCACTVSGQVTAPPSKVMNSRCLTAASEHYVGLG